jgi:hypothetical protein
VSKIIEITLTAGGVVGNPADWARRHITEDDVNDELMRCGEPMVGTYDAWRCAAGWMDEVGKLTIRVVRNVT